MGAGIQTGQPVVAVDNAVAAAVVVQATGSNAHQAGEGMRPMRVGSWGRTHVAARVGVAVVGVNADVLGRCCGR